MSLCFSTSVLFPLLATFSSGVRDLRVGLFLRFMSLSANTHLPVCTVTGSLFRAPVISGSKIKLARPVVHVGQSVPATLPHVFPWLAGWQPVVYFKTEARLAKAAWC